MVTHVFENAMMMSYVLLIMQVLTILKMKLKLAYLFMKVMQQIIIIFEENHLTYDCLTKNAVEYFLG